MDRNRQLARAFRRIFDQRYAGWEEFHACDRQFDGGEWSDAAHDEAVQRAEQSVAEYVAERFGVPVGQVEFAVLEAFHEQEECFYRALDEACRRAELALGC